MFCSNMQQRLACQEIFISPIDVCFSRRSRLLSLVILQKAPGQLDPFDRLDLKT